MNRVPRTASRAGTVVCVAGALLTLGGTVTLGACSGSTGSLGDSSGGTPLGDAALGDALPSEDAGQDHRSGARIPDASPRHDAMASGDGGEWHDAGDAASLPDTGASDASVASDVATSGEAGIDSVPDASATPIAFVQVATATVHGNPHVTTTFLEAPHAGDLIVVAVGTTDTGAMVTSVSDTGGNSYALAVGPTIQTTNLAQYLFYARNIASAGVGAGAYKVTVTYNAISTSGDVVDMRSAEYSGLNTLAPLDGTAEAAGDSASASCGPVATTSPHELLFAAAMSLNSFSSSGKGFNLRAISADGDLAEDQVVATAGPFTAAAQLESSSAWVIQLAAFR